MNINIKAKKVSFKKERGRYIMALTKEQYGTVCSFDSDGDLLVTIESDMYRIDFTDIYNAIMETKQ